MYFLAFLLKCTPIPKGVSSQMHELLDHKRLQESLLHIFEEGARGPSHTVHQKVWVTVARIEDQGQDVTLRVTLVGQEALMVLHCTLNVLSGRPIEAFDETSYQVTAIDVVHPQWSATWGWADMLRPCYNRCIRMQFVTPVQLRFPGTNSPCFPNAHPFFAELHQSWRQLNGPSLPDDLVDYLQDGGCVVSDYRLSLQGEHEHNETMAGFRGFIMYDCHTRNLAHIAALHTLARLAFFTGVGSATRQGMGVIRVQEGSHRSWNGVS